MMRFKTPQIKKINLKPEQPCNELKYACQQRHNNSYLQRTEKGEKTTLCNQVTPPVGIINIIQYSSEIAEPILTCMWKHILLF